MAALSTPDAGAARRDHNIASMGVTEASNGVVLTLSPSPRGRICRELMCVNTAALYCN
jgi:hypothetical protein